MLSSSTVAPLGSLLSLVTTSNKRCVLERTGVQLSEVVFNASVTVVHVDEMGAVNGVVQPPTPNCTLAPFGERTWKVTLVAPVRLYPLPYCNPSHSWGSSSAIPAQLPAGCAAIVMLRTVPCTWSKTVGS